MQPIPQKILARFKDILQQRNVPLYARSDYRKWLRYFLIFITIQTLLGHADIRTTMIYLHCIPAKAEKEVKSPLDL